MPATLRVKKPVNKLLRLGVKHVEGKANCRCGKCEATPPPPAPAPHVVKPDAHKELVGKAVFFASEGERVAGKAVRVEGDSLVVQLALPGRDGLLMVSESEITVKASDLEVTQALLQQRRMKAFEGGASLTLGKSLTIRGGKVSDDEKDGPITDYLDVEIEGYGSTFVSTTKRDRGGDYILPGAFDKTIAEFMKNPVILIDHRNAVDNLAGSWAKVGTNDRGLAVLGKISNAPGMRDTRFKLKEGHLKGLSIGGMFFYTDDNYGIDEVNLFEISLTPIPMNQDALAYTRSLDLSDCRKAFAKFWRGRSAQPPG